MLFSSMVFLWIFLPVVLVGYYLLSPRYRNYFLLLASIVFYGWSGVEYLLIIIISISVNYISGLMIAKKNNKKTILITNIIFNIALLGYFKYFDFFAFYINRILAFEAIPILSLVLPVGISFYTFQALSYTVDLYNGKISVQKNFFYLALYIMFFPQLIAGPIVRYETIEDQINNREVDSIKIAYGIKRFIYGLSKKVIISNILARFVDTVLSYTATQIGTPLMWFAMICYALQIYYDFSGYSDMAIGLGKMLGFDFLENFNYPYISQSIQEFWRRWHISLSTWFREYVYIPLGGNRKGSQRTLFNLSIVFLLTGFWHGAGLNFIFWGLWHGLFSILERGRLGKVLANNKYKIINYIYVYFVVLIGWVFFRADGIKHAISYLKVMFSYSVGTVQTWDLLTVRLIVVFVIAIMFCGFGKKVFPRFYSNLYNYKKLRTFEFIFLFILMVLCIILLISDSYNPFIYFRF